MDDPAGTMNNLMTVDEIIRTFYIAILAGLAIGTGFGISWLVNKDHIQDLQSHVRDLKEAIFALLPRGKDSDGDDH